MEPGEGFISLAEAAKRLGLATQTLYQWRAMGDLGPAQGVYKFGGRVRVDWERLRAYMTGQRRNACRRLEPTTVG